MTAAEPARVPGWRTGISAWPVFVAAIILNAGIQSLLVLTDPVPTFTWTFAVLTGLSLASAVLSVWLIGTGATAAAQRRSVKLTGSLPGLLWTGGLALLAFGAAIVNPLAGPVVLLLGAFILPAALAGAGNPISAGFVAIARAPVRQLLAILAFVGLVAVSWGLALLLGFLVTGSPAALLIWIWFGVATTLILRLWCALYRRAQANQVRRL